MAGRPQHGPPEGPAALALGPMEEGPPAMQRQTLYLIRFGTQEMLAVLEVKGEATEASSSESEMPPWALFRACPGRRGVERDPN